MAKARHKHKVVTEAPQEAPQEDAPVEESDIKLDITKVKDFFRRVNIETVVIACFVLVCMLMVMYVRLLPASLPVTDDWATSTIQQNIRSQVSQQVDQQYPALPQTNRDALIQKRTDEFVAANKGQFDTAQQQLSQQFKTYMRYTGDDGKEHTYLGDLDSYFWLRYTRNFLNTGTACDEIHNGQCWDNHITAPYGGGMSSDPSLHVFAIAFLYKFITVFNPHYPLPATSFLVPVLMGMLGVIPAFFIGRRLAGNVGGVFAALLTALNPLLLSRSMGSDNDVWNVVIPLFIMWMVIEALEAKKMGWKAVFAVLAGAFVALHAATWEGWWFIYLIILFALIGYFVFRLLTVVVRKHEHAPWKNPQLQHALLILVVFYVATFLFLIVAGHSDGYFSWPNQAFSTGAVLDRAIITDAAALNPSTYWPNVLTTVAELNKSSLSEAVGSMGGKLLFFGCMLGMLLMVLPRRSWRIKHYVLAVAGGLISLYLLNTDGLSKFVVLGLFALPIAIVMFFYLFEEERADVAAALIVLVWFMAAVYATYSGVRFILLMVPAFGIGFAVLAGRVYEWVTGYVTKELNWHQYIVNAIVFVILALVLIQPVKAGYQTAYGFIPSIDDAWWNTLTKIHDQSAPDAIINSWWDFGHWFKYVADRRVSADGTSQGTHVPRWLGLALVTSDEHESIGTLRMLTCASDVYPQDEGKYGAYGILLAETKDTLAAQQMVRDIIKMQDKDQATNRADARAYLQSHGIGKDVQDRVLNATLCDPPQDYFITSGDMVGKAGVWAHFGLWNFSRAYMAQNALTKPADEAIPDFEQRFNMSKDAADQIYYEAKGLTAQGDINTFVSPWPGYITSSWVQCRSDLNDTVITCPIGIGISKQDLGITSIDSFVYNATSPNSSRLVYGFYQNNQRVGTNADGTPQVLVLALQDRMVDVHFNTTTSPGIAVLMDVPNKRVLLADPLLVKSMFTQLFYLDGRYEQHFTKFDDETSFTGTRIITWTIDWAGRDAEAAAASSSGSSAFITGPKGNQT